MSALSPFERLRRKYEASEPRCRECGEANADGGWRVTAAGSRVQYQFTCPTCGATDRRVCRLERR